MSKFHIPTVVEQRQLGALQWLQLHCPALASQVRPGQYLLLRCADAGSADPLLRRAMFVAGTDAASGILRLLYAPSERGLQWLSRQQSGAQLDAFGPLGRPFQLEARTGNLLLVGHGSAIGPLLALAEAAVAGGTAVVLLLSAPDDALLPPPYLLPPEVEYQSAIGDVSDLIGAPGSGGRTSSITTGPIAWADQLCAVLPQDQLRPLIDAVRTQRLRWSRGFAHVAIESPMPCGTGACLGCLIETRDGWRTRCKDGPVFDLKGLKE